MCSNLNRVTIFYKAYLCVFLFSSCTRGTEIQNLSIHRRTSLLYVDTDAWQHPKYYAAY